MRCIDADALEKEGWSLHRTIRVDKNTEEYQTKPLKQVPTIEPQRKKGKWINVRHDNIAECDQCGITGRAWMNFCFDCGADMREDAEEPKKCDTCKHEKERWFSRCADCSDYELWESKE